MKKFLLLLVLLIPSLSFSEVCTLSGEVEAPRYANLPFLLRAIENDYGLTLDMRADNGLARQGIWFEFTGDCNTLLIVEKRLRVTIEKYNN